MPNYDGTGPLGNGPRTGRGRGRCMAGNAGMGLRGQGGRGFGRRGVFQQDVGVSTAKRIAELEEELASLKARQDKGA